MSVISNKNKNNNILGTPTAALLVFLVAFVSQLHAVYGNILISKKEEQCLDMTAKLFGIAGEDLLNARNEFATSMDMNMTSRQKMYAKYPEEQVKNYGAFCTKYGGKLHTIKLDFFDCTLGDSTTDIELTLKNFATCMEKTEECEGFGQEHLLQEAWKELGLTCVLEEEETKKDPPKNDDNNNKYDNNDDLAKREKEAAAGGADEVDKEEKESEYVPKEQMDKNGNNKNNKKKKSGFGGFMKFVLFVSVCGAGYFVFDRRRRGLPIELPWGLQLPFGGATTSRFQARPQTGFVSNYNLLSGEENELHLSSNLA